MPFGECAINCTLGGQVVHIGISLAISDPGWSLSKQDQDRRRCPSIAYSGSTVAVSRSDETKWLFIKKKSPRIAPEEAPSTVEPL